MSNNRRPPLADKASQETLISLLQLDPMPMADAPPARPSQVDAEKELPPLPIDEAAEGAASSSATASRDGASEPGPAAARRTTTTSSLGLSSSGHGAVYYLSRVQRYSSYAFVIFTSVHLVTTSIVPLATRSVSASESYLLLAREIYQTRISEPLLVVVPVVAHVAAGVGLRLVRRAQNLRRYGGATPGVWPALRAKRSSERRGLAKAGEEGDGEAETGWRWLLHPRRWWDECRWFGARLATGWPAMSLISVSGYVFFVSLAAHVAVNRVLPLAVEGDSSDIGLAYIAHGFARHPVTAWLSYLAFLGAASGHMVWGWARWLNLAQTAAWSGRTFLGAAADGRRPTGNAAADRAARKTRRRTWLAIQSCVLLTFGAWAAGGLGVVARGGKMQGWVGNVYDGLFQKIQL
ncbi:hypothetical protein SPI_05649 [Niveomyces insectorum RCEF 264]|uniref:Mitochondrial adapter protein MCP1 transmembrane domain-containing protein n=1 Tax=Niveomyces insectorum RCEF 264 TaxID=1081102 RepID=A0A167TEI5_9HYPO|nr:hypothetical protein SPI_05649 [Niveomyces insectorum RCEF 264]